MSMYILRRFQKVLVLCTLFIDAAKRMVYFVPKRKRISEIVPGPCAGIDKGQMGLGKFRRF